MNDQYIEMLIRRHDAQKKAMRKYYEKNREAIAEQRSQKWKNDHPNPKPRGRPPKVVPEVDSSDPV